jgi:hypothetical protein
MKVITCKSNQIKSNLFGNIDTQYTGYREMDNNINAVYGSTCITLCLHQYSFRYNTCSPRDSMIRGEQ